MKYKTHTSRLLQVEIKSFRFIFLLIFFTSISLFQSCSENVEEKKDYNGPLFTLLSKEQSKINFINEVPENPRMNIIVYPSIYAGAGVSVGDINNDGLPDIFFTKNFGDNQLYLNKGNLVFEEIGKQAGVIGKYGWATGSTMVDINGDGLLDIYLSKSGDVQPERRKNELYINQGNLTFVEKAADYGIDDAGYASQSVFFDYDKDGDLDMYLLNAPIKPVIGDAVKDALIKRNPETSDKLFRNDNGNFVDVSEQAGLVGNGIGYGLSASIGDLNNDGWPDLYVCNDYIEHDYLYYNNQDGTFSEKLKESVKHTSTFSMGSDMADFNNDGLLDIMMVDMVAEDIYRIKTNMSGMNPEAFNKAVSDGYHYQYMMNTLQMNNGNGTFSDVAQLAGISSTDWSWAPLFADFDNDGLKDLLVTNGLRKDVRNNDFQKKKQKGMQMLVDDPENGNKYLKEILDAIPVNPVKNYIFKNEGELSFTNKRDEWGLNEASFSNGAAYADLDNDGDLDIIMSNIDEAAFVYENNSEKINNRNYLKVKLKGELSNQSGLGTRIVIKTGDSYQMKEHYLNRGYLSSVEDVVHFGVKEKSQIDSLWVKWPDGNTQVLTNVSANKTINITYEKNNIDYVSGLYQKSNKKIFEEVSDQLNVGYKHLENDFNDFEKESLLPHKMSTLGPGMSVADVNDDGLDDFYIGGAKGSSGKLYFQNTKGLFSESVQNVLQKDKNSEDVSSLFFDADSDGDQDLYVVSGGYDFKVNSKQLQDRLYINDGKGNYNKANDALPIMYTSGGSISAEDYDNDGDLDLFVGGRVVPGTYPKSPRSYLLKNTNGKFEDVTSEVIPDLLNPGLVTSSVWVDIDNDQKKDLVVVGEWMPISVFKNNGNSFVNITETLGLDNTNGWWNVVKAADFDKDGDVDFVVGNLGLNYKYKASPEKKFNVFFDDFDNNNTGDIVLTFNEDGVDYPLRGRQCSSEQMPFIKEKFGTYDEFAKANMVDVFGEEKLQNALHLEASTFATSYIENNLNEKWKMTPLPNMAQLSSTNGIVIEDFDEDGSLDIIIAGNMYNSEVETPRNDAANGLLLKGNGKGDFNSLPFIKSGFFASGDVKGLNTITVNRITHFAVVNNNGFIQFFKKI